MKTYLIKRVKQVSNIEGVFIDNYKLKLKKIDVQTQRLDSLDVIGIWAKINDYVHAFDRKSLYICD